MRCLTEEVRAPDLGVWAYVNKVHGALSSLPQNVWVVLNHWFADFWISWTSTF